VSKADTTPATTGAPRTERPRTFRRRLLKATAWGCGGAVLLLVAFAGLLFVYVSRVPQAYSQPANPLAPPTPSDYAASELDGFESPYLGHTGSWDGKGGNIWGGSKVPDLEKEAGMGLRWTFMPVNWSAMEPERPTDLKREAPPAWRALDAFVIEAQRRRLNVLMQAPVVGGNAGGPPAWAGRRERGKSAPLDMTALAAFAGKLAGRYCPGGTLAREQGWGSRYGVRAWELDNEPEMYRTHWEGQAGDYAEFLTLAATQIRTADPKAWIVAPALAAGKGGLRWLDGTLDPGALAGSPMFRAQGRPYAIGRVLDVVSFHNYEGLDSAFSGEPRTVSEVLDDVRAVFEKWERRTPGFTYSRKKDYWHTEGNFDFVGALSAQRRAAWRMQFFTRAFAAGLRKVCVMDASEREQAAVRAYVRVLPWPFPMNDAVVEVRVLHGCAAAFRHPDGEQPEAGQVWIIWAIAGTGDTEVEVPVRRDRVRLVRVDGASSVASAPGHRLTLGLRGDSKMAAPVMVVDRVGE